MRAIQGKNVTVKALRDGVMIPFACATSCTVHLTTELIKRTSVGNGSAAKYKARMTDWSVDLGTVTHILPLTSMWTVFDVAEETIRKNGIDLEVTFVDSEGNLKTVSGHVLIPQIDITATTDGFSEDSITFQGSGIPGVYSDVTPGTINNNKVKWNTYKGTSGETGFTDNDLIGRELILVLRGDALEIITTGTPDIQQVKFISSTGQLIFGVPLGAGELIYYLYQQP